MAVAIFQCSDSAFPMMLGNVIANNPPFRCIQVKPDGRKLYLLFRGDCETVYYYCMDVTMGCDHRAAFVGIDEIALRPSDYYDLAALTVMSPRFDSRRYEVKKSFNKFREDFFTAINRSFYSYDEVFTICQRCVLGVDKFNSVKYCTDTIHYMSVLNNLRASNIASALDCHACWANESFNTMVLCMAHFCYLRLPKFRR